MKLVIPDKHVELFKQTKDCFLFKTKVPEKDNDRDGFFSCVHRNFFSTVTVLSPNLLV